TGRDILYGGAGHDHLVGDDAFDRFVFVADSDMIYGGDGGDLIEGNGGGDYLYGGDGNDAIYGDYQNQTHVDDDLSGGDYIEGGAGNDTLMGQAGNDTIHGGDGNDKIYGNDDNRNTGGDNQLYGEDGDDYIQDDELYDWDLRVYIAGTTYMDGGLGADTIVCATTYGTIIGGANPDGNVLGDVLRVSTRTLVGLTITGIETLDALGTVTATLAQFEAFDHIINTATEPVYEEHIPTLKLADAGAIDLSDELGTQKVKITASSGGNSIKTGSGADILIGGAGDDTLMGGAGDDSFSGGAGADTMVGGAGNDTFVVDNAGDVVTEVGGQGTEVIQASISYALSASVEVLTLTGSANIDGTGNSGKNTLNGNAGNNNLNGGAGADTMAGGLGDDTYYVNDAGDRVIESDGGGTDTVFAGLTYSGAGQYIENITLLGSGDISALGNGLDNTLRGNAGNNSLNGSGGADTMIGGAGNDSYSVDDAGDVVVETGSPGVDVVNSRVTFDIGTQYIEVVNLTSSGNVNAYGSTTSRAETLNGNTGANLLDGRNGADTMAGGAGNDTYVVDNPGDVVTENASEGTDTVRSLLSYILTANVENLELQGASNINGTGNGLANILTGNGGNNRLDGGTGADTLIGGLGDDSYYVDNAGDVTVEANGQGMDTVFARVSYVLGATAYIDVLTLAGAGNINGTGNGAANALNGNGGNNSLDGASGNDTLTGGAGNDTLTGGNGADAFVFGLGSGQDVVNDFKSSQNDTLNIHAYSNGVVNGGGVTMTAQGSNT
ncbi:MAG: hypothetical protein JF615_07880, partial [Asticcacaulis sp.]|nr:hypothetical protein [Asticcacaulis sp.]